MALTKVNTLDHPSLLPFLAFTHLIVWISNPLVLIKFLLKIVLITPLFLLVFLLGIVYIRLARFDSLICSFKIKHVWSLFMINRKILLLVVLCIFCNVNRKGLKIELRQWNKISFGNVQNEVILK